MAFDPNVDLFLNFTNRLATQGYGDSGDATNAGNAITRCLGKYISTGHIADNVTHNCFDVVTSGEANPGPDVEYRAIAFVNENALFGAGPVFVWFTETSPGANCAIGIDPQGVQVLGNGTSPQGAEVASESTAPPGSVVFSTTAVDRASALPLGTIADANGRIIWVRRTVPASTPGLTGDSVTLFFEGTA